VEVVCEKNYTMEVFIDGGILELLIAATLGFAINFIFAKKYLPLIFSVITLAAR